VVIRDAELTGEALSAEVQALLADSKRLSFMAEASAAMGHPNAAGDIAALVLELADGSTHK
jgi:UDP-N-acetylglucosamine:LPS N-acetylglucosamine transferase